jgi:TolA-binding protein
VPYIFLGLFLLGAFVGCAATYFENCRPAKREAAVANRDGFDAFMEITDVRQQASRDLDDLRMQMSSEFEQQRSQMESEFEQQRSQMESEFEQQRSQIDGELRSANQRHATARDACRLAVARYVIARLIGKLQELICVLRQPWYERLDDDMIQLLDDFAKAESEIDPYDQRLASMLAHSGRALEFTVHPENGPSVTAATNPTDTAGALRKQCRQVAAELEAWLHGNPVPDLDA